MREFTIRKGIFAGKHSIYDSLKEATDAGIKKPLSPWHRADVAIGDWVVSDDGFIIQCLHRYVLRNKVHRSGQYTDCFRFPNGTFYVYVNANQERKVGKNFYAAVANNNPGAIGNTPRIGRYLTPKKKLFVSLIAEGADPYSAYIAAFNKGFAKYSINKLLNDPIVREALMHELEPIYNKIENQVKEKTGLNLTDFVAAELVKVITFDTSKLAMKERRENLKLILQLFGERVGLVSPRKSVKDIPEVNYEEVKPPMLGLSNQ